MVHQAGSIVHDLKDFFIILVAHNDREHRVVHIALENCSVKFFSALCEIMILPNDQGFQPFPQYTVNLNVQRGNKVMEDVSTKAFSSCLDAIRP